MKEIFLYNKMEKIRNIIQDAYPNYIVYATIKYVEDISFSKLHPIIMICSYNKDNEEMHQAYYLSSVKLDKKHVKKLLNRLNEVKL